MHERPDLNLPIPPDADAAGGAAVAATPGRADRVRLTLPVEGMSCASCVRRVETAAARVAGVSDPAANFATGTLSVSAARGLDADQLVRAIEAAGYQVKADAVSLAITEMRCASCVGRVEKALRSVPGVRQASVNLATGRADLQVLGGRARLPALIAAVKTAGYGATALSGDGEADAGGAGHDAEADALRRDLAVALVLTLPVVLVEMGGHLIPQLHHAVSRILQPNLLNGLEFVLAAFVLVFPGRRFFSKGLASLFRLAPEMNSLVALGAGAAFAYSTVATFLPGLLPEDARHVYFEAAMVIVTLILAGRMMEARAKGRTGAAIRALVNLRPKTARVERDGVTAEIPAGDVMVGDIVIVRPGETVAVDGRVIGGESFVDQSMISGEPVPVARHAGDPLIGGTVNGAGVMRMRAEKVGAETMLSGIIRLVGEAQGAKLPIQRQIDTVTGWFVPAVMLAALVTFGVWMLVGPAPAMTHALVAAVAVLIIACPCAMGLATPVSIMVGTGRAAELGLLIRKGEALEALAKVDTVVLDKTGTITAGKPAVTDIRVAEGVEDHRLLQLAASLEANSEHPLARAIMAEADRRGIALLDAVEVTATVGHGVSGRVDGVAVAVGAARQMAGLGIATDALSGEAGLLAGEGRTPVYIAADGRLLGLIAIADPLKDSAAAAVNALKALGISVVMATGDLEAAARAVADRAGIDAIAADLLPDGKVALIRTLQAKGRKVGFVGDGINDGPALAAADIGLAIGTGTDVAIESADLVLVAGDPAGIATAIRLGRAVMRNIGENLVWAFGYNVALIPVAAGALYPAFGLQLSPMLGAAAMGLSSVFVLANALRLKRFSPPAGNRQEGWGQ
ncbi:heavy metal translocating P-type ATPase [Rhizobium halophytocola]|uniref:Heavy metal translocating P-type ATPase n=1 Tax=Rhizobium halophytocola TaxID=735519 RepID=A0ABS4E5J7_9HYPH|nr:heavy metal translocating P-type ATPase [Rhizobium halophytocola]MBP1853226.1 heavy metal translocating P-type ATPase [Rhizobium halophytocola]